MLKHDTYKLNENIKKVFAVQEKLHVVSIKLHIISM